MHNTETILAAIANLAEQNLAQHRRTRELCRRRFTSLDDQYMIILVQLQRISTPVEVINQITVVVSGQSIHVPGLRAFQGDTDMSYTIPRDHQDEPFTLDPITISDSEGPVTKEFTETFESDNPDVVSIDAAAGTLHFGTFGGANLTRKVTIDGQEFIVATAVFNVTPGALTVTGNVNVPGLTPDA